MILVHRINCTWVLHGVLEPSRLLVGDLSFHFHEKDNKFKGLVAITLESIRKAKNKRLSMGKTNLLDKEFDNSMLQDRKNKYCMVSIMLFTWPPILLLITQVSSSYINAPKLYKRRENQTAIFHFLNQTNLLESIFLTNWPRILPNYVDLQIQLSKFPKC